jgi:hypothetical protein
VPAKQQSEVQAGAALGMPGAASAPSPGGLFFGDDNCALGLSGVPEFHADAVGRIGLEEMKDAFTEKAALEALVQQVRRDDVVNFF